MHKALENVISKTVGCKKEAQPFSMQQSTLEDRAKKRKTKDVCSRVFMKGLLNYVHLIADIFQITFFIV